MRLERLVSEVAERLQQADLYYGHGTENPWDEAAWLVMHQLSLPLDQPAPAELELSQEQSRSVEVLVDKRIQSRKPLAYLINSAWFCGYEFYVDERVIVPRSPIAELIQQDFSPWLQREPKKILDLCTGSACIAIACAKQFAGAEVDASDISHDALAVAEMNIQRHGVQSQVNAVQADVFSGLPVKAYDLILSNPPYVDAQDMSTLPKEYQHEPDIALASGEDGLNVTRRILSAAMDYLTPEGVLVCEVGNSEEALVDTFPQVPFTWLEFEAGGHGVFLLTADDLSANRHFFM